MFPQVLYCTFALQITGQTYKAICSYVILIFVCSLSFFSVPTIEYSPSVAETT